MARPRLLFLAETSPAACGFGPRHQSYRMLGALACRYDVTLLVIKARVDRAHPDPALKRLKQRLSDLEVMEVSRSVSEFKGKTGANRLRSMISQFDHLLIDHPSLADFLPGDFPGLLFFHRHLDDTDDQLEKAQRASQWRSRFSLLQQPDDPIGFMLRRADVVFSEGNREASEVAPGSRAGITSIPFAFNEHLLTHSHRAPPKPKLARMLFVADSADSVMTDALKRFLSLEWIEIRRRFPRLRFDIALPAQSKDSDRFYLWDENISVQRFNGSWDRWSDRGHFFINPVSHPGSISQTLNAMALGMPVMGYKSVTSLLPEGLPATTIDPSAGAVQSIARVLQDRLLWQRCEAARHVLAESYATSSFVSRISGAIDDAEMQRHLSQPAEWT